MDQDAQVSTSDFTLAAILLVNGFRLYGAEPDSREPERRKRFVFAGNPNTFAKLSRDLVLNDVLVPARAFANAQRRLKRLLYDAAPAAQPGSGRPAADESTEGEPPSGARSRFGRVLGMCGRGETKDAEEPPSANSSGNVRVVRTAHSSPSRLPRPAAPRLPHLCEPRARATPAACVPAVVSPLRASPAPLGPRGRDQRRASNARCGRVCLNGPSRPLRFVPLAELIDSSPTEPDWIWPGYLAPSVITLLAGRPKVGKSTLLFALMEAIDRGSSFCGRSTRRLPIVLLSEERAGTVADKAQRTSWTNSVTVLLHHTAYGTAWGDIVRQAADHVGSGGLLIVDTLADFAGLPADSENNAGAIQSAIRPLQEAAASGCAVLLVTHQRKAAGEYGGAVRGSNALTAAVDIVLELERAPSSIGPQGRVLKAVSRFGTTPGDLVVSLSERGYEAKGELAGATAAAELDRLAARLAEMGEATAEDLAESAGLSKGTAQRHLNAFRSAGRAASTGSGKRGDPFRWRLISDSAREIPYGRIDSAAEGANRAGTPPSAAPFDATQGTDASRFESSRISEAGATVPPGLEPQDGDAMVRALLDVAKSEPRWLGKSGAEA